jgi:H+/Cl- antiporter ClcA
MSRFREILAKPHPSQMLIVFSLLKLIATICSLGSGGVSAMFVPLLLVGGCIGNAFGQSIVHSTRWIYMPADAREAHLLGSSEI